MTANVGVQSLPSARMVGPFRILAVTTAGLILVQAFLAGQWWFQSQVGLIAIHGWLGNTAFVGALLLVILATIGMRLGGSVRAELVLSLVLVLLMVAQLGLGYSGRRIALAASLHIPNGVLLTMVIAALIALAWRPAAPTMERS